MIEECSEINDEINKSYLMIKHDMRECAKSDFDRETISIHDIDFLNVVDAKTNVVIDVINEKTNAATEKNEKNFFDFLQCLMRT